MGPQKVCWTKCSCSWLYCEQKLSVEEILYSPVMQLSLFGHIVRMSDESDAKQILTASPLENWRRPPGRLHTMWMKTTQQDLKSLNLCLN